MTSRRSKKRSVSLRTSSFIRLISPFRQKSVAGLACDPKVEKFPGRVSGLQTAFSDTQLNISCKSNNPLGNVDNSIAYSGPQRKNPRENVLNPEHTWTSQQELSQNNARKDPQALRGVCISDLNLNSDKNLVDTSWLGSGQGSGTDLPPGNWSGGTGIGLLGRTAVSYQNISPTGDIFGECVVGGGGDNAAIDKAHSARARPTQGFNADANKSTTNVAWLVGAARKADENHHIDIRDQDLQPPSHLAVAPIIAASTSSNSPLTVTSNSSDSLLSPSSLFANCSTPSPSPSQKRQEKVTPVKPNVNSIKMGYSLSRSKTVSDLPFWADEVRDQVAGDRNNSREQAKQVTSEMVKRNMCSDRGTLYSKGLAAATVSTMGSLKSKIVRHKTLLGSSSRLYKFSQSLSSLTTITSESRPASATSTFSRDHQDQPGRFEHINNRDR